MASVEAYNGVLAGALSHLSVVTYIYSRPRPTLSTHTACELARKGIK